MANHIFPDEGLDVIFGIVPKNGTNLATTYLGLFTGGAGTTVPANTATVAAMGGSFAEVTTGVSPTGWPAYARQSIAAASWGASGAQTIWTLAARGAAAGQVVFTTPAAVYTPTNSIGGFFIADALTAGHALLYSNFTDLTPIATLAIGDLVKVTPTWGFGG
jgi:hypothetical protein